MTKSFAGTRPGRTRKLPSFRGRNKVARDILSAKVILDKMKNKTYKLNGKELHVLVRYKHAKGDKKIPSLVAELCVWWNETRNRASLRCSPNNSDDEEEENLDDEEGGEMGTTGLVFGHDESEDKCDD